MTKSGSDSGNKNEKKIAIFFGNGYPIKYSDIPESNLKKFVLFICKNKNVVIRDDLEIITVTDTKLNNEIKWSGPGKPKIDMNLKTDGLNNYISFKSGGGNSTEEEKVSDFIKNLKSEKYERCDYIEEIKNYVFFDGFNDEYIKKTPSSVRGYLINWFAKHKEKIIKKAIIINDEKTNIEFFYVTEGKKANFKNGVYANSKEILSFLTNKKRSIKYRAAYGVGRLTLQTKDKKVHPGKIQFKWANPYRDIKIVRNND